MRHAIKRSTPGPRRMTLDINYGGTVHRSTYYAYVLYVYCHVTGHTLIKAADDSPDHYSITNHVESDWWNQRVNSEFTPDIPHISVSQDGLTKVARILDPGGQKGKR